MRHILLLTTAALCCCSTAVAAPPSVLRTLWTVSFDTEQTILSPPALGGGALYFAKANETSLSMHAVDARDGSTLWNVSSAHDKGNTRAWSPVFLDGVVVFTKFYTLEARDAQTGTLLWSLTGETGAYGCVVGPPTHDGKQTVVAVWWPPTGQPFGDWVLKQHVVQTGQVVRSVPFCGSGYDQYPAISGQMAVSPGSGKSNPTVGIDLSTPNGSVAWTSEVGVWTDLAAVAAPNGFLITGGSSSTASFLSLNNGSTQYSWQYPGTNVVSQPVYSSATNLFILPMADALVARNAANGSVAWRRTSLKSSWINVTRVLANKAFVLTHSASTVSVLLALTGETVCEAPHDSLYDSGFLRTAVFTGSTIVIKVKNVTKCGYVAFECASPSS